MQNKFFGSKINTVLLLILIIITGFLLWKMNHGGTIVVSTGNEKNSGFEEHATSNKLDWLSSETEGAFLYDPSWKVEVGSVGEGIDTYSFALKSGSKIFWPSELQSQCNESEFGVFNPGASSVFCLRGMKTSIEPAKGGKLTSEDLKSFGDFVLKNK